MPFSQWGTEPGYRDRCSTRIPRECERAKVIHTPHIRVHVCNKFAYANVVTFAYGEKL